MIHEDAYNLLFVCSCADTHTISNKLHVVSSVANEKQGVLAAAVFNLWSIPTSFACSGGLDLQCAYTIIF